MIAINIDGFRRINTLHGAAAGDHVLRVTADRLASGIRSGINDDPREPTGETDLIARLGADEFAVICSGPAPARSEAIAKRLLQLLEQPIAIGDQPLRITASAGLVVTTDAHYRLDDVLRDLDLALRRAKELGPGMVVGWNAAMTRLAMRRYTLAEQLQRAFGNGEFLLHYQPVVGLADGRMVGAEASLRWNHPSEGLLSPESFTSVLDEVGLVGEISNWLIREAVRQVEAWQVLYGRHVIDWVSVDLPPRQFDDPRRLPALLRALHKGGVSLNRLQLEIAQPAYIQDPAVAAGILAELRALGLRLGIDDPTTSGGGLAGLQRFPIDAIRIAGSLVAQIGTADGETLLRALLEVARIHGVEAIAGGVETAVQRDFLLDNGCHLGLGYIFAQPMDAALLGAYALTHGVQEPPEPPRVRAVG